MINDLDVLLGPEDQSIAAALYLWPIPQGSQIGVCGLAVSTAEKGGTYFQEGTVYATTYNDKFEGVMGTKIVYHNFHDRLSNASHLSLSVSSLNYKQN